MMSDGKRIYLTACSSEWGGRLKWSEFLTPHSHLPCRHRADMHYLQHASRIHPHSHLLSPRVALLTRWWGRQLSGSTAPHCIASHCIALHSHFTAPSSRGDNDRHLTAPGIHPTHSQIRCWGTKQMILKSRESLKSLSEPPVRNELSTPYFCVYKRINAIDRQKCFTGLYSSSTTAPKIARY